MAYYQPLLVSSRGKQQKNTYVAVVAHVLGPVSVGLATVKTRLRGRYASPKNFEKNIWQHKKRYEIPCDWGDTANEPTH